MSQIFNINELTTKQFSSICRLCTTNFKLQPLLSDILNIYVDVTHIKAELGDKLPNNVCDNCANFLKDISNFIGMCRLTDSTLRKILNDEEVKEEEVPPEQNIINSVVADQVKEGSVVSTNLDEINETLKIETYKHEDEINDDSFNEIDSIFNLDDDECTKSKSVLVVKKNGKTNGLKGIRLKCKVKRKKLVDLNCSACTIEFENKIELRKHYKKNPSCNPKRCVCDICNKSFNDSHKLTAHIRTHTKENPFVCDLCDKKFRFSQNLTRHKNLHLGIKPFKCDECGQEFSRAILRDEHKFSHTGETPYNCDQCGKKFGRYQSFYRHMNEHKYGKQSGKYTNEKKSNTQVTCEICNRLLSSKTALHFHLLRHKGEKTFLCYVCGKSFVTKAALESHSKMHTGDKPFQCPHCDKSFSQYGGLSRHVLIHTGERPHICPTCGKSFVQTTHLKNHMRIHSGEKLYSCTFCKKSFTTSCALKIHVRIHTGETPYVCSECNRGFYDPSSLRKHKIGHAKEVKQEQNS